MSLISLCDVNQAPNGYVEYTVEGNTLTHFRITIQNNTLDYKTQNLKRNFISLIQYITTVFIPLKPGPVRPAAGALRDPVRHQRARLQGAAAHDHRPPRHERRGQEGRL